MSDLMSNLRRLADQQKSPYIERAIARIYGYQAPASLAVFKNKSTQQYEIVEVPL